MAMGDMVRPWIVAFLHIPQLLLLAAALPWTAQGQLLQPLNLTGYVYQKCNGQKYDSGDIFSRNLNTVIGILTQSAAAGDAYHLATLTDGSDNSSFVYATYQCRGDLSANDCNSCIGAITRYNCSGGGSIGMRVQLVGCYFRYEKYDFTNPDFSVVNFNCSSETNGSSLYQSNLAGALNGTAVAAPKNGGYAANKVGTAYALSQCFGYLSPSDCAICLSQSSARSLICNTSSSGYFYYVTCLYLFSDHDFLFSNSSLFPAPPPALALPPFPDATSGRLSGAAIAGISVGSASALLLTVVAVLYLCILCRRRSISLEPQGRRFGGSDPFATIPSEFLIAVEELEAATGNLHSRNRLGQGGFGVVYKGMLRSGKEVAIKIISRSSNYQGNGEDFLNEAKLITTVQHRNLIQLLGCAKDDARWYLVYEYFPNQSLDVHLFGSNDEARALDWKTRFNIIKGIARGLCYLHEDSHVRIVHRDIKSSNILLDGNLEPKIADFGLARLFAGDMSHLSCTAMAGTLGYVAPEYAMRGQLSEKVDVYSFGLVTLEVVSGRKAIDNNAADPEKTHILQWAWGLYERKREVEMVDRRIPGGADEREVAKVVQVALLCTQTNPQARPSMSQVYLMLRSQSAVHDIPSRPGIISMGIFSPSQNYERRGHRSGSDSNPAYDEELRWNSATSPDIPTSTTYTTSSVVWRTETEWSQNGPESVITELLPR